MKIDPNTIVVKVARYYDQDLGELQYTCKCREGQLVKTRQVTMFFLREMTSMSLNKVGMIYKKDHATVIYACKQIRDQYDTNKHYRQEIDDIRSILLKYQKFVDRISYHYNLMKVFGKQLTPLS